MIIKILHGLGGLKTRKECGISTIIYQYLPCELVCQICGDVLLYVPLEHHKGQVDYHHFKALKKMLSKPTNKWHSSQILVYLTVWMISAGQSPNVESGFSWKIGREKVVSWEFLGTIPTLPTLNQPLKKPSGVAPKKSLTCPVVVFAKDLQRFGGSPYPPYPFVPIHTPNVFRLYNKKKPCAKDIIHPIPFKQKKTPKLPFPSKKPGRTFSPKSNSNLIIPSYRLYALGPWLLQLWSWKQIRNTELK